MNPLIGLGLFCLVTSSAVAETIQVDGIKAGAIHFAFVLAFIEITIRVRKS